jgi:hypothetical protein
MYIFLSLGNYVLTVHAPFYGLGSNHVDVSVVSKLVTTILMLESL